MLSGTVSALSSVTLMGAGRPAPIGPPPTCPPSTEESTGCSATSSGESSRELLVLLVVSMSVFALFFYGPSDPALAYCPETRCTPQRLEQHPHQPRASTSPVLEQYGNYMKGIFAGNDFKAGAISIKCDAPCLGVSFKLRVNVTDYLLEQIPSHAVDSPRRVRDLPDHRCVDSGIFAARRAGHRRRQGHRGRQPLCINAIPYYLLALLAYLLLISQWAIFPESGYFGPLRTKARRLGQGPAARLAGARAGLLHAVRPVQPRLDDRVDERGLRAHGAGQGALRAPGDAQARACAPRSCPVVTIFGLDFAFLLAGTIFTERIFDIQGIGLTALQAIGTKDLPIISATVLIAAAFIVVANLVVDIIYSVIDPRVRLS